MIREAIQANIDEGRLTVGADHRIGGAFLRAGLGRGGSRFSKYVPASADTAEAHGRSSAILDVVLHVNSYKRQRALDMLLGAVVRIPDPTVAVLGLTFRPKTGDLRQSPAMDIVSRLSSCRVKVQARDPVAKVNVLRLLAEIYYCNGSLLNRPRSCLSLLWTAGTGSQPGRAVI